MSELRGLGDINTLLEEQGGRLFAIAVDAPQEANRVVERNGLDFPVLCDTERKVIDDYGLVHKGGGPDGTDIAVPANILIDKGGRIAWRYVASRVKDRLAPDTVAQAIRSLAKPPPAAEPPATEDTPTPG